MTQVNSTKKPPTFFNGVYGAPSYMGLHNEKLAIPTGSGIYEDTLNKLIMFPVAGYTKPVTCHVEFSGNPVGEALQQWSGSNRQAVLKNMIKNHGLTEPENKPQILPGISIRLVPEPLNPYDEDAILVIGQVDGKELLYPLGYVPSKINKVIADREGWFKAEDFILIIRPDEQNKYTIPQLCIKYEIPEPDRNRFRNIEYD